MIILVFIGIYIAKIYYKNLNNSYDPRIIKAKVLYGKYNDFVKKNDYQSVFNLLDSVEIIYDQVSHYKNSYEKGVVHNNRCAAFLSIALNMDSLKPLMILQQYANLSKDSLLNLAGIQANKGIVVYENWLQRFDDKDEKQINETIHDVFFSGLESYEINQKEKYLKRRIKEIQTAQYETKRRLSVSYTNLGTVYRHREAYHEAALCFKKAIDLWDRNLTAENNLNILFNKPLKKRNILQKLFPPERKNK
ncbi:hypothetical protein ACFL6I_11150 [candidate division KSB1 bacterium]